VEVDELLLDRCLISIFCKPFVQKLFSLQAQTKALLIEFIFKIRPSDRFVDNFLIFSLSGSVSIIFLVALNLNLVCIQCYFDSITVYNK
jgi:hypothetical protein